MYVVVHGGPFDGVAHQFNDDLGDPNQAWLEKKFEQIHAAKAGIPIEPELRSENEWLASFFYRYAATGDYTVAVPSPQWLRQVAQRIRRGESNIGEPAILHRYSMTLRTFNHEIHAEFIYLGEDATEDNIHG